LSRFEPELWINSGEALTFYPNVVTLVAIDRVQTAIAETEDGFTVKDSFALLDLAPLGFVPLFEAMWIWRDAQPMKAEDPAAWHIVRDAASLVGWEEAWRDGAPGPSPFRPALLEARDHAFIAAEIEGRIVAGCVASRSASVVGVSNLFGAAELASGCLASVQSFAPNLPVVGYETDPALEGMKSLGFQALGPLRVWLRKSG
jgi:hypothetical protein